MRLGFFDGDGAVLADLVHRVGDDLADGVVPVGGDGGDLRDFVLVLDLLGDLGELVDDGFDGLVDAALERDRVGAGGDVAAGLRQDGLGENGGGGGAVAGDVAGLAGDFPDELGAHVFVGVFELDFLGDRDAVLGDGGGAEFFVEDDVAARRAEGGLDGAGEFLDAAQEGLTRVLRRMELFGCHGSWCYEYLDLGDAVSSLCR